MEHRGLVPEGDKLRKAVQWLSDMQRHDTAAIMDAALRYDLSPLDEAFLLEHFRDPPPDPE